MKTAIVKLKDIQPAAYNPRIMLKPGDKEYEALKNSLERFGVAEPLVVNETTGNLVSGHQRLNVLKTSGVEEVEVILIQMSEEQEKLLNIAMNKIEGEWDYKKLEELFDEILTDDIKFTGFTIEELENLFDDVITDCDDNDYEINDEEENEKEEKVLEEPHPLKNFSVFISFPSKALAEKWLTDRGIKHKYVGTTRNITIRMEGIDYGTGN